eukprot:CAMPEP_0172580670 /NCGR_PEP_ID=MMETSP1067-20121228/139877_1 /TAXON_ID=265564 ORGANISM="Thalassiosira punctigera, Strain Tpunct2005C2" /NCGR_SAMPLE_ID=MMETSP1067 /ASSEMBLY_ACC=CAM_ASM_000444 /LENGTH=92 /DNA_ID=CAMNT_0013373417 /DNA_START=383 /DNA_END=661 /DNA_ORIENTATION=-
MESMISSPMKHHGMYGSNGTSARNPAGAKKNPAAMNGICVGCSSSPRYPTPVLMRMIFASTSLYENSHVHSLAPGLGSLSRMPPFSALNPGG